MSTNIVIPFWEQYDWTPGATATDSYAKERRDNSGVFDFARDAQKERLAKMTDPVLRQCVSDCDLMTKELKAIQQHKPAPIFNWLDFGPSRTRRRSY